MNDLIGIPYQWRAKPSSGKTDCFQLVIEVRRRLGFSTPPFDWVYDTYSESTFTGDFIRQRIEEVGDRCEVECGAIALMPSSMYGFALGCCTEDRLIYISTSGFVVQKPFGRLLKCVSFYRLKNT